ncbi:MAG: putative 2-dehydropantoate 2-reductase [Gammaproteobacteria bacterium]|nr:putative 2-dehydropantoate 2-reductase [Gammaproteobacteria bacterium]
MTSHLSRNRSYAILGTGAVGGFYGARLQRAGAEVHFLLHSDYEIASRSGLRIDSADGDFTLPKINAYREVRQMPPCDVAVVALKTTRNELLPRLLPPVLKDSGVVLMLQNGLGIEAEAAAIVGDDRVMGGLCFLCSNKAGPAHIRHLDYSSISLGEYAPHEQARGVTERMREIAADFARAGISIRLVEDLVLARWQKLVWNVPFNGLSVMLDAATNEIMADASIRDLARDLMRETVAGAKCRGRIIPEEFLEKMLNNTAKMKPYKTSMKLDYDAKHPLELEAIYGNLLRTADDANTPKIAALYQQLLFLDRKNRKS